MNHEEKEDLKARFNRVVIGLVLCFAAVSFFAISMLGALQGDNPPSDFDVWLGTFTMIAGIVVLITATFVTDKDREGNL